MSKILIAEDDQFLVKVYKNKFEKEGFAVRIAQNGEEVFDVLKDFTPELILLDIIMPKKDGFTTLEELKKNTQFKNIPVIMTSNLGQPEDKQKAHMLGAIEYIVKSDANISDIVQKVKDVLAH